MLHEVIGVLGIDRSALTWPATARGEVLDFVVEGQAVCGRLGVRHIRFCGGFPCGELPVFPVPYNSLR